MVLQKKGEEESTRVQKLETNRRSWEHNSSHTCHLSSHTPLLFRDFTDKLREWSSLIKPGQACSCHHKPFCSHGARSVKLQMRLVKPRAVGTRLQLLKEAYGENSLSCVHVFEWYRRFPEGGESTEDDQHPGQPVSTQQTVAKINEIVCKDHCMSIQMNTETVNADKETVRKILHGELNTNKIFARLLSKTLNPDQELTHQQICPHFLERLDEEPELMENIITRDETWIFQYNVEIKWQSMHWKTNAAT